MHKKIALINVPFMNDCFRMKVNKIIYNPREIEVNNTYIFLCKESKDKSTMYEVSLLREAIMKTILFDY